MNLPVTIGLILAAIGGAIFCGWMGAKPKDYAKPRMIPWQMLMLVCAVGVLILIPHLLSFFGINTGQNR